MSGSRPESEGHLAEQHLGDRLSALVDGELGHDARERVLAHVATCLKCKAEVDAQRRLKNVFAAAAPPAPSESFLARLQGLPGGGDTDGGGSPLDAGGFAGGLDGVFGSKRGERFEFGYVPARPHSAVPVSASQGRGFRIHDVSRHESERSSSRGLRFACAAAGAVSLAAIALGGVTVGTPDTTTEARGSGSGSNVTPTRTQGAGAATSSESQRRRSGGPLLGQGQGQRALGDVPVAPTAMSAPLLPGVPAPSGADPRQQAVRALTTPVMAGAAAMSPLIRPLEAVPPLSLTSWSMAAEVRPPGLLAAPVPDPGPSPFPTASSASPHRPVP
ncbi:anti-sigma factor family protein [Streptomyces sp. DH41]|uniref:anti-sigma factor family protein n=1 Tax=Streptomyces sp. DH41 TaxID=3040125 RepID=UPI0024431714|nr:zf-HC2 domain-containing protein [Streptomyces sp. DH41]MDG9721967.1 zf-HC2 domain-containing protein [Streptomyces sp. DH41]